MKTLSSSPAAVARRNARAAAKNAIVETLPAAAVETLAPVALTEETAPAAEVVGFEESPAETLPAVAETISEETAPVPYSARLIGAIVARMGDQSSKDLDTSLSNARKGARSIDALYANPAWATQLDTVARKVECADKRDARFIAVKALVKIIAAIVGQSSGVRGEFDPYSQTIVANLASLSGLSNKSALVCLSRSVVYDETEAQQALTRRYNCSASTASTQASSTRMMLMHLGVCDVVKGKRGDVTQTNESERCIDMLSLFAPRT